MPACIPQTDSSHTLMHNQPSVIRDWFQQIRVAVVAASIVATLLISDAAADEPKPNQTQAAVRSDKERLRYAGRTFDEWREQLLYDLDAETCVKAMPPIAAFGRKGYAAEAVEALASVLRDEHDGVVQAAASALAEIGPQAVPSLIDALGDSRPAVRASAASALSSMGADGEPAAEALVKLVDDQEHNVRFGAVVALVAVAGADDAMAPTFKRLALSRDDSVRLALAKGVQQSRPKGDWWLLSFLRFADDDNDYLRQLAAQTLTERAPATKQTVETIERLANDSNEQVRMATGAALISPPHTSLKAAALANLLAAHKLHTVSTQDAIRILGQAQEEAELVVPVLTQIAASGRPEFQMDEIAEAIDSLGKLGRSAKAAIPALERWAFDENEVHLGDEDSVQKHARRALRKIAAGDDDERAANRE
jgi:hypothetical protein